MNRSYFKRLFLVATMSAGILTPLVPQAQNAVRVGKGSYAEYPPMFVSHKAGDTDNYVEGNRGVSHFMQSRKLWIRERENQPLPSNNWWMSLVVSPYSDKMWSYPQWIQATTRGVDVHFATYWIDNGTEMKSNTMVKVGGLNFNPESAIAEKWNDWDVAFSETDGNKQMYVTQAHGVPFTYFELENIVPTLQIMKDEENAHSSFGSPVARLLKPDGSLLTSGTVTDGFMMAMGPDVYGIYLPPSTEVVVKDGVVRLRYNGDRRFVVVGVLPSAADFSACKKYAYSVPRDTRVDWQYDESAGKVHTTWTVLADNLLGEGDAPVLQGFIPHHYRDTGNPCTLPFTGQSYLTPRGKMKMAVGNTFNIDYNFYGMMPVYALPDDIGSGEHPFDPARMEQMISHYISTTKLDRGPENYWFGKPLLQMAHYMWMAREMGLTELFEQAHDKIAPALKDWFTYTPGEREFFYAYMPRWGGLNAYKGGTADDFTDHHFCHGYYTYAAALLAMVDDEFRNNYGGIATLVAKDYANWDREDTRYPFFRTFDPWEGHSFSGGIGLGTNGQESSSESMQGWGGMYFLGLALGDRAMRDAAVFGWVSEARGTAEYWFDRHTDPSADWNNYHQTWNEDYNIDYSKFHYTEDGIDYTIPYNSNLTSQGVGWWTWFGFESILMSGIQWLPISPALDYLGENKDFVKWDYNLMMSRLKQGGFMPSEAKPDNAGNLHYLGDSNGWGNAALSYYQYGDAADAARIFDEAYAAGAPEFTRFETNGITYFLTHSHLSHGDLDWTVTSDCASARAFRKSDGSRTYQAYNPGDNDMTVRFSDGYVLDVPARQLAASDMVSKAVTKIYPDTGEETDPREEVEMVNIALNRHCTVSSQQNTADNVDWATDGDESTRWGSLEGDGHDEEWLYVDLGEQATVYKVKILWETAYASRYKIQVSDDRSTWRDVRTVSGDGEWDEIMCGDVKGRYLKVQGLKRGTQYGISIKELQVFGRLASAKDGDIMGVRISSENQYLKQGHPCRLTAEGLTYGLNWVPVSDGAWTVSDGTVTSDGVVTPAGYGNIEVGVVALGMKAVRTLPVEEAEVTSGLKVTPASVSLVENGSPVKFTFAAGNQWTTGEYQDQKELAASRLDSYRVCTVDDKGDLTPTALATFDPATGEFSAPRRGSYALEATLGSETVTAFVDVKAFADVNLALHKNVEATSVNGGNVAAFITDGELTGGRWESVHRVDPVDITLDLDGNYVINRIALTWENAFASEFDIQVSANGSSWADIKHVTDNEAGTNNITFDETAARYVRLHLTKRHFDGYGFSLYEMEVYGIREVAASLLTDHGADERGIHRLTGTWSDTRFADIDAANAADLTAYNMAEVEMPEGTSFSTVNPNAIVIVSDSQHNADRVTNSRNVVAEADGMYSSVALKYVDGHKVNTSLKVNAASAEYSRDFPVGVAAVALPFSATVPAGMTAYTLSGVKTDNTTTTIKLSQAATLEAGKPYILVVDAADRARVAALPLSISGRDVAVGFTGGSVNVDGVEMKATFIPVEGVAGLYSLDETGSDKLSDNTDVAPFRAYFALPEPLRGNNVRLMFDNTSTGCISVALTSVDDVVYSIDGRCIGKLSESDLNRLPKGVYIRNGRKFVAGS